MAVTNLLALLLVSKTSTAVADLPWPSFLRFRHSKHTRPLPKPISRKEDVSERERQLWKANVSPLLKAPLWQTDRAYSAGHVLMVPLHAAFELNAPDWQQEWSDHFKSFLDKGKDAFTEWGSPKRLNLMQYDYLATRFLVLASEANKKDLIPAGLAQNLSARIKDLWTEEPSISYDSGTFKNMKDRLVSKLDQRNPKKSYYNVIIDEERFLFAEAADLKNYERLSGAHLDEDSTLDDILQVAYRTFKDRVTEQSGGGWLFDAGGWKDHPDYQYAGRIAKTEGMQADSVPGIGEDSSHSHRMALWLTSLAEAYPASDSKRSYYLGLRSGLDKQFFDRVLVKPSDDFPSYRLKNFMDGSNGVYRYNYKALGAGNGYGPYELSGTWTLGWWTFLDTDRVRQAYADQASKFPLPESVLRVYLGGTGTANIDSAVKNPASFNGMRELLSSLAAKLHD